MEVAEPLTPGQMVLAALKEERSTAPKAEVVEELRETMPYCR